MKKIFRRLGICGILLGVMLLAAGAVFCATTVETQAAGKTGFVTKKGKSYYYKDGKKYKGWLKLNGKKYYLSKKDGHLFKGFVWVGKKLRYFDSSSGEMYTGLKKVAESGKYYYFNSSTGYAISGWVKYSGKYRYFNKKTYAMTTGWAGTTAKKRYFNKKTGYMLTGLQKIGSSYYYFNKKGLAQTGWVTFSGSKTRYFDPSTYAMVTGTKEIDGYACVFSSTGVLTSKTLLTSEASTVSITTATSERTIKNFLANALKPVGQCLYVWGGGHNADATRKGVNPNWATFYNSQSSSYTYTTSKSGGAWATTGLDCSGYVGWSVYQIMQENSGGTSYTEVSGDIGSAYKAKGLGTYKSYSKYVTASATKLQAGDIGFDSGHTWIILGVCSDGSAVILHSTTQAGVQISGTPTYSGSYSSEAISLAKKYMSLYSGYKKYTYNTSSGNYLRRGSYFRFNKSTLSDPNGYKSKTAAQILKDLYGQ